MAEEQNTTFSITAKSKVIFTYTQGAKTSVHDSTLLAVDYDNLNIEKYQDEIGCPNKDGAKLISIAFTQGLIANIHNAHHRGYWNDAEHLRYIISELERGFIENVDINMVNRDMIDNDNEKNN